MSTEKKMYYHVQLLGGSSYTVPKDQLHTVLDGELDDIAEYAEEGITLTFKPVWLTKEEFDALGDFEGH